MNNEVYSPWRPVWYAKQDGSLSPVLEKIKAQIKKPTGEPLPLPFVRSLQEYAQNQVIVVAPEDHARYLADLDTLYARNKELAVNAALVGNKTHFAEHLPNSAVASKYDFVSGPDNSIGTMVWAIEDHLQYLGVKAWASEVSSKKLLIPQLDYSRFDLETVTSLVGAEKAKYLQGNLSAKLIFTEAINDHILVANMLRKPKSS